MGWLEPSEVAAPLNHCDGSDWIGYAFPTPVSAVGVGAVLDRDDFNLNSRLEDLVDDPVVPPAGTAFAGEPEPQWLADSVRVLSERTVDELHDRRRDREW